MQLILDPFQAWTGQAGRVLTGFAASLSISVELGELVVEGDGPISVSVTEPLEFLGTYEIDTTDLPSGPVNLAPPSISGTAEVGEVLTAANGLWVYDADANTAEPVLTYQWQRDGVDPWVLLLFSTITLTRRELGASDEQATRLRGWWSPLSNAMKRSCRH